MSLAGLVVDHRNRLPLIRVLCLIGSPGRKVPSMSSRSHVNKRDSSRKFSRQVDKVKAINVAPPPMRGGIRL